MEDRHLRSFLHLLIALNLLDVAFTVYWVECRFLPELELNPIMAYSLSINVSVFVAVKALMILSSAWLLWRCRSHRLAGGVALLSIPVYTAVLGCHLVGLALHLFGD